MKKIGIIIQMLSGGGAERTAANLSIDLSKKYEVHLIVFDCSSITYKHGGVLHCLGLPAKQSLISKIATIFKRIKAVQNIKKQYDLDATISLMQGANIVNIFSKYNDKVVISERNLISFFIKNPLDKLLEILVLKKADCIVALSEVVRKDLIKTFSTNPDKIVTIYNSVDLNKFRLDTVIKRDETKPVFVTMGRLTMQKAQWHLFKAMTSVVKTLPDAKLIVLGKGELLEEYKKYVRLLNIENNIEFLGFQADPHNYIISADAFVFSSMVEGLGSVILEALACGKAIISTDCDAGPREILAPDTNPLTKTKTMEIAKYGILVPTTENDKFDINDTFISPEEQILADAMIRIIQDVELKEKYEIKSKERIVDFMPSVITKQWIETLNR